MKRTPIEILMAIFIIYQKHTNLFGKELMYYPKQDFFQSQYSEPSPQYPNFEQHGA